MTHECREIALPAAPVCKNNDLDCERGTVVADLPCETARAFGKR